MGYQGYEVETYSRGMQMNDFLQSTQTESGFTTDSLTQWLVTICITKLLSYKPNIW